MTCEIKTCSVKGCNDENTRYVPSRGLPNMYLCDYHYKVFKGMIKRCL